MDERLLTIGRFARLTGLSEGALRHYDELELLTPAAVDAETGYRRYSPDQVERAQTIGRLRALQMPLEEIRGVLGTADAACGSVDSAARARRLARHRARLEARAVRLQRILHVLNHATPTEEQIVTVPSSPPELDSSMHRALGAGLFNHVWELIETEDRTAAQDDEMIHAAHASRHHWAYVGEPVRLARGEWICSRVYATLDRAEPALWHARRCHELLLELDEGEPAAGGREDWDLPAAFEALARASAVAGDRAASETWAARCREALGSIADPEDRQPIEQDIASLPIVPS